MFEFLNKVNLILSSIGYIKKYKILSIFVFFFTIAISFATKGYFMINDNSIYKDNKQDNEIKEQINTILKECGDKHAIGLSTVSTDIKTAYYAKFKEFLSYDKELNEQNSIIDLMTGEFPFKGDYSVDQKTYTLLCSLANKEDPEQFYLPTFELNKFPTIKGLIDKSEHYKTGDLKNLFLTALENQEKNLIYVIHLTSWAELPCQNAKYLLNELRKNLPLTK
jgi:hypothetical protein